MPFLHRFKAPSTHSTGGQTWVQSPKGLGWGSARDSHSHLSFGPGLGLSPHCHSRSHSSQDTGKSALIPASSSPQACVSYLLSIQHLPTPLPPASSPTSCGHMTGSASSFRPQLKQHLLGEPSLTIGVGSWPLLPLPSSLNPDLYLTPPPICKASTVCSLALAALPTTQSISLTQVAGCRSYKWPGTRWPRPSSLPPGNGAGDFLQATARTPRSL